MQKSKEWACFKTSCGDEFIVDYKMSEFVSGYSWHPVPSKKTTYVRNDTLGYLHRVLMGAISGDFIDHVNGDGLDNRLVNLRFCTHAQNIQNQSTRSDNSSGYRGVSFQKDIGRYRARITTNGKKISLGTYTTAEEASAAYEAAANFHFGEFKNER